MIDALSSSTRGTADSQPLAGTLRFIRYGFMPNRLHRYRVRACLPSWEAALESLLQRAEAPELESA